MRKIILIVLTIFVCNMFYGMSKNAVFKDIIEMGYTGVFVTKDDDNKTVTYKLHLFTTKNRIRFDKNPDFDQTGPGYINYDKIDIDKKEYTIYFLKADGRLIIKVHLLNNKGDVELIDYGEWMVKFDQVNEKEYKKVDKDYDLESDVRLFMFKLGDLKIQQGYIKQSGSMSETFLYKKSFRFKQLVAGRGKSKNQ